MPAERTLLSGDPAGTLANEAAELDALIMGSRGHGPLGRILLSSVSAELMRAPACPLFVVPRQNESPSERPIVLCYDGSEPARHAIAEAGRLFGPGPAIVLHAYQSLLAVTPGYPLAGFSGGLEISEDLDRESSARAQTLARRGRRARPRRRPGGDGPDPAHLRPPLEGDRRRRAASATPRWSSWAPAASRACARHCIGSVSNGVIHHSDRPVLVVPPPKES